MSSREAIDALSLRYVLEHPIDSDTDALPLRDVLEHTP